MSAGNSIQRVLVTHSWSCLDRLWQTRS